MSEKRALIPAAVSIGGGLFLIWLAKRMSHHSSDVDIEEMLRTGKKWQIYIHDIPVTQVATHQLRETINYMKTHHPQQLEGVKLRNLIEQTDYTVNEFEEKYKLFSHNPHNPNSNPTKYGDLLLKLDEMEHKLVKYPEITSRGTALFPTPTLERAICISKALVKMAMAAEHGRLGTMRYNMEKVHIDEELRLLNKDLKIICAKEPIWREKVVIVGCQEVAELTRRALRKLGLEPRVYSSWVTTFDGKRQAHVWVEVDDYIIETNPSQIMGVKYQLAPVIWLPRKDWEPFTCPESREPFELVLTSSGQRFFDKLADEIVKCIKSGVQIPGFNPGEA